MIDERTRTADDRLDTEQEDGGARHVDVGAALGRYEIVGRIGAGGMGVVYRARDPALDRELAIKVVPTDGGAAGQARLLREAQAMARLHGVGVVPVFDVGTVGDGVFVVMPYLTGGTLGAWLAAAPRPWRDVLDRFIAAGRGLAVAHAAGLVHRDFKPDNVLLDDGGEIAVADFGLARPAHASRPGPEDEPIARGSVGARVDVTRAGAVVGTPAYMAPEQLRGEPVDARADVFSFCASLYQGLYGERPFATITGTAAGAATAIPTLLDAIAAGRVRPAPAGRRVPAWLRAVCIRGLAADPAARWPSIDVLLAQLDRRRQFQRRLVRWGRALAALGAAVLVVGALAGKLHGRATAPTRYLEERLTSTAEIQAGTLSPDGRRVAYLADRELRVLELDSAATSRVLATDADVPIEATTPQWSDDGREIYYPAEPSWKAITLDGRVRDTHARGLSGPVPGGGALDFRLYSREFKILDAAGRAVRTCPIPGDYTWMKSVIAARGSEDVFVIASTGATSDRLYRTDLRCSAVERIAPGLELTSAWLSADGDGLVATVLVGDQTAIETIDRTGQARRLDEALHNADALMVGQAPDGGVLLVDGQDAWRLVRTDRRGRTTELAAGSQRARFALSPDGHHVALIELVRRTGALRVRDLASPRVFGRLLDSAALAVDWSPDGKRLAALTLRGGIERLVVMDASGGHRNERVIPEASADSDVAWVGDDAVAYRVHGNVTYAVVDLATGARHDLLDRTLGWAADLHRARSGALRWLWNRRPTMRIWAADRLDAPPRPVVPEVVRDVATSLDDDAIYLYDEVAPMIDRLDVATGLITPYATLPFQQGAVTTGVYVLDGGDVLAMRAFSVTELVRLTPQR